MQVYDVCVPSRVCVCACVCTRLSLSLSVFVSGHIRGQLAGVPSLLPTCVSQGLNTDLQCFYTLSHLTSPVVLS